MFKRLSSGSMLILGVLILMLSGCENIGGVESQTVWKKDSDNKNELPANSSIEIFPTPTLRSKQVSNSEQNEAEVFQEEPGLDSTGRSVLLTNDAGESDHLKGIGRLVGLNSCTAALIDTSQELDAPAYVLTAGRCVQPWLANEILLNELAGDLFVIFNYFADSQEDQIEISAKSIAYSTMKGHDLAIIELEESIGSLREMGVSSFPLREEQIEINKPVPVVMIGAPVVGFTPEHSFLRREECLLDGSVDLVESQILTYDNYRTDCQDNYSGSSGSPIFDVREKEILGIVSSTTVAGHHPCSQGGSCEIIEQATSMNEGSSYATHVSGLSSCINNLGQFDISLENCPLENDRQIRLSSPLGEATSSEKTTSEEDTNIIRWNVTVEGEFSHFRYKSGPIGTINCREERGYGEGQRLIEGAIIGDEITEQDGINVLCVLGGDSQPENDQIVWQSPESASAVVVRIDNTPPERDPIIVVLHEEEQYSIQFHTDPPELSSYHYKTAPENEISCDDFVDYAPSPNEPIHIPKGQIKYKLCVIAIDSAGNEALPYEVILGGEIDPG